MRNLAWVDIETTGLEPEKHIILELGIVITDPKLNVIDEHSWLFNPTGSLVRFVDIGLYVLDMHTKNGLWAESFSAPANLDVPNQTVAEIEDFLVKSDAMGSPMHGSSIHFDRKFIEYHLPQVAKLFHYRNFDVSTIKQMMMANRPDVMETRPKSEPAHRAIPDCHASIAELEHYYRALGWL